jgi:hypothetical protein
MASWLVAALVALAQDVKAEAVADGPPAEVAEAVRKELAPGGVRVSKDGKPLFDFWLGKAVAVRPPSESLQLRYTMLKPGTFVGVVKVHAEGHDFKNQKYPAGVYTMRYAEQPEDGDHQGTAETKDFLCLSQAAADAKPDPISQEDLVKLSSKVVGRKHPAVLYLVRSETASKLPAIAKDEANARSILECEAGTSAGKLRLAIVVVGKAADH